MSIFDIFNYYKPNYELETAWLGIFVIFCGLVIMFLAYCSLVDWIKIKYHICVRQF